MSVSPTKIDAVADGIYRIHTPVAEVPGGFSFNQYLIVDDAPLLFHTGPRKLFPLVSAAIERVMPLETLRYVGFSHVEADECGAMNDFLAAAPEAEIVCGRVAAMVSVGDLADRAPKALGDGEELSLGKKKVRWLDAPHLPHGWDAGYIAEETTRTLFCGDLFTQPGAEHAPVTSGDILGPSEAFRAVMDYFAHGPHTAALLAKLAKTEPRLLACMHGAAWEGNGADLLGALGKALAG